ncbi:glycosyltransferase family 4 protein [Gammaproteobacteria bacterium]|jgi:glycosyltransferase involved in cell wall biosynthesis|nr:glycosyltransferase family 4 protein [Gammaproteobacteria bacterium]
MFVNIDKYFFSHRLPIAQASRKHNVDMSVFAEFTLAHPKDQIKGFQFFNSPLKRSTRSIFNYAWELFKSYKIIKKEKPDLIHAVTIKPIIILGIVSRLTSTPFIGSFAGLGPVFQNKTIYSRCRLYCVINILKFIYYRKDVGMICQNSEDQNILANYGLLPLKKILLISGSGVDIRSFTPQKKQKNNDKYVLMSSRILLDKGINEFCYAANQVRQKLDNNIKFLLSGSIDHDSPTFVSELEIKKITNENGVEYLGERNDMPELLASALIFVLPSYYAEGLPKVLLEAAASGLPIITTDHPGCREAIINQETGLLVPVQDYESLAMAIISLLENQKLLKEMGSKARLLAENLFDDKIVVKNHFSYYKKLLDSKPY